MYSYGVRLFRVLSLVAKLQALRKLCMCVVSWSCEVESYRFTVASVIVRFMRSTCPSIQGCLGFVSRCSIPCSWQHQSHIGGIHRAVGLWRSRSGWQNGLPLSVKRVWIVYGTMPMKRRRHAVELVLSEVSCSSAEAKVLVRLMATNR